MSAANQWDLWYKNECVNTCTFHVVLCLLYIHTENSFIVFDENKDRTLLQYFNSKTCVRAGRILNIFIKLKFLPEIWHLTLKQAKKVKILFPNCNLSRTPQFSSTLFSVVSVTELLVWMIGEVAKALMEIVNYPPLITAPSNKLIGVLLALTAAVSLVVVVCVWDEARLKMPDMSFFVHLSYYSLLCFAPSFASALNSITCDGGISLTLCFWIMSLRALWLVSRSLLMFAFWSPCFHNSV